MNIKPQASDLFEYGSVGLFEISDAGTVLYCRTGEGIFLDGSTAVGRNFFDEVAPFENTEELRRHFNYFIKCDFSSENFTFTCRVKNQDIPAKIKLVRVSELANNERVKTTIVDIRKL